MLIALRIAVNAPPGSLSMGSDLLLFDDTFHAASHRMDDNGAILFPARNGAKRKELRATAS